MFKDAIGHAKHGIGLDAVNIRPAVDSSVHVVIERNRCDGAVREAPQSDILITPDDEQAAIGRKADDDSASWKHASLVAGAGIP